MVKNEEKYVKKNNLKKVLIISIVFACILLFNLGILLFTPWEESQISKYDNINLYINNSYDTLSEYDLYQRTSANCKKFIPAYKDFEYKQHITGFYVFDGTKTYTRTAISFVLELQFDDIKSYEQFLSYEYDRQKYTNNYEITYIDWTCLAVSDENLTYYAYQKSIPYQFGLLCKNEKKLKIRYVYFRECELSSVDNKFRQVFKDTNCTW